MRFCRRGHHFDAVSMKKRGLGWNIGELGFGEGGGYEREEEWGGGFGFGERGGCEREEEWGGVEGLGLESLLSRSRVRQWRETAGRDNSALM